MDSVRPRGRPEKTWSEVVERLSEPTNMKGGCYRLCKMEKVN